MTTADYIQENENRKTLLFGEYDPYRGIGSPIERFEFKWDETSTVFLPMAMKNLTPIVEIQKHDCFKRYWATVVSGKIDWENAALQFNEMRVGYDFEYWAAQCAIIKHKETAEYVPFIFNPPQREAVGRMERQRLAGLPVRLIVLKHRQWGCTTLSYTYIAWHQIELYTSRDAWFIGIDKGGGEDVISRYAVIIKNYPFRKLRMRNFGSGQNAKILKERNSVLNIGTVEKPNAPSGRTPHFAHMFEVGKWPSNPSVNAENVVQNVESMMHDTAGSICIQESTAKADTGTYFKSLCESAEAGKTSYDFLFVGWLSDPTLVRGSWRLEEEDEDEKRPVKGFEEEFIATFANFKLATRNYCKFLWDSGATLEQIAWYQNQLRKPGYIVKGHYGLMEEYPTTSEEAFQTGAKRVFPPMYVKTLRKTCKEPIARGYLTSDADEGRDIFKNIRWVDDINGKISIWRWPDDDYGGLVKKDCRYINRTLAALDLGGEWEGADYSDCAILDRFPTLYSAQPEIVAEWHGHEETDLFAAESARLAHWYHRAEYIPESNKFESNPHKDDIAPDSSYTVLDLIAGVYPGQFYMRQSFDSARNQVASKLGFHMNQASKKLCMDALRKLMRLTNEHEGTETVEGYVERNRLACDEMDNYLYQQDGKKTVMAAAAKKKDDRVIVRAMLAWRHLDLYPVREIKPVKPKPKPVATMARFG